MLKILGLGNVLRGDDGVGPKIISELQKKILPLPVNLIDVGSDAFTILEHLIDKDPVVIIDCAKMGKSPGEVARFKINKSNFKSVDSLISIHGFGFSDVFNMAESLGGAAECIIIGVEPKSVEVNTAFSEEVKNSFPLIIQMVIEEINKYAKNNSNH